MIISVLGTGAVGRTLGAAWLRSGHDVRLGSRSADNPAATAWAEETGGRHGTFADVTTDAQVVVNATPGMVSAGVLDSCGPALDGLVVLDAGNALDFSAGFPPTLAVCNDDSLAEQLQRAHPEARVVKALNMMAVEVMVQPARVPGEHVAPICGDDEEAKSVVTDLLADLGWPAPRIIDLGGLDAARGMEMWLPLWLRLYGRLGHPMFNLALPVDPNPTPRG